MRCVEGGQAPRGGVLSVERWIVLRRRRLGSYGRRRWAVLGVLSAVASASCASCRSCHGLAISPRECGALERAHSRVVSGVLPQSFARALLWRQVRVAPLVTSADNALYGVRPEDDGGAFAPDAVVLAPSQVNDSPRVARPAPAADRFVVADYRCCQLSFASGYVSCVGVDGCVARAVRRWRWRGLVGGLCDPWPEREGCRGVAL